MKILVLLSAWVSINDSVDATRWTDFYIGLMQRDFRDCDKIIAFNPGCDLAFEVACRNVPNVIHAERVRSEMDIKSDASGFQSCMHHAKPLLNNYDIVLFLHTKGASRGYEIGDGFRWLFGGSLLKPEIASNLQESSPYAVHALFCHPPTHARDIRVFKDFLSECSPTSRPFLINVTYTVYYVSASLLASALRLIPQSFLTQNLQPRFNRFFFELDFPSFLVSIGGNINFVLPPRYNEALNRSLSYNYDLSHGSALVNDLYLQYLTDPDFSPCAVPMIFGPIEDVRHLTVSFDLFSTR